MFIAQERLTLNMGKMRGIQDIYKKDLTGAKTQFKAVAQGVFDLFVASCIGLFMLERWYSAKKDAPAIKKASARSATPKSKSMRQEGSTLQKPSGSHTEFKQVAYCENGNMRTFVFSVSNLNKRDITAFCREKRAEFHDGQTLLMSFSDQLLRAISANYYSDVSNGVQWLNFHKDTPE
jgi:hypothetical protein